MKCLAAWALLGAAALGCAPAARPTSSAEVYRQETISTKPSPAQTEVAEPTVTTKEPDPKAVAEQVPQGPDPVQRKHDELALFYDAVDALRAKTRQEPVRVLWLGDSHTAADFMTGRVREHLARIGGDGGPGFVRLGLDGYRHEAVRVTTRGQWRKAPILPAQRTRVLDGVFGYGGIRTLPVDSSPATAQIREPRDENLRWTISYRLGPLAKMEVKFGEQQLSLSGDSEQALAGRIETQELIGSARSELSIVHRGGEPQVFGVFGEYIAPGMVLDTVGINGARAATALAWEPDQYVAQLKARGLALVVIAFGTNEVFDLTNPERYVEHTTQLIQLARQAKPDLPCWIIGAPDSATHEGTSKARVIQVNEAQRKAAAILGCAFTSAFALMGGPGSFSAWARERPARASSDRIHLTIAGYRSLGDLLAADLIDGVPLISGDADGARAAPPEYISPPIEAPPPLTGGR